MKFRRTLQDVSPKGQHLRPAQPSRFILSYLELWQRFYSSRAVRKLAYTSFCSSSCWPQLGNSTNSLQISKTNWHQSFPLEDSFLVTWQERYSRFRWDCLSKYCRVDERIAKDNGPYSWREQKREFCKFLCKKTPNGGTKDVYLVKPKMIEEMVKAGAPFLDVPDNRVIYLSKKKMCNFFRRNWTRK